MELLEALKSTGLSLLFLMLVFIPMEKVFPAKIQSTFRPGWVVDFLFFIGQYLFWNTLVLSTIDYFNAWLNPFMSWQLREIIATFPVWAQSILVILLSDIVIYWAHRLQHQVGFLWRFHKVHHSARHLDWLAAHREHPLDSLYTISLINLPAFVFGFSLEALSAVVAFRGIWAIYIHSNVSLNIGPLKYIIGSPELHHKHHTLNKNAGNYANVSPLMDLIFGTHTGTAKKQDVYGISEEFPENYSQQIIYPLLPTKLISIIERKKSP